LIPDAYRKPFVETFYIHLYLPSNGSIEEKKAKYRSVNLHHLSYKLYDFMIFDFMSLGFS